MAGGIESLGPADRVTRLSRVEGMFPVGNERLQDPRVSQPDPTEPALILEETASADGARRAMLNVNDGISMVQTAQRASTFVAEDLYLLRELALVGRHPGVSAELRELLIEDSAHAMSRIDYVAANAHYQGIPLVNGTLGEIAIQAGNGTGDTTSLYFDSLTVNSLGLEGASLATARDANVALEVVNRAIGITELARDNNGAMRDDLFASITTAGGRNPLVEQQLDMNMSSSAAAVLERVQEYLQGEGALASRVQSWGLNRVSASVVVD